MISLSEQHQTIRLRPTSFLLSLCIHVSVLALLAFAPQPSAAPAKPIYDAFIRPNEKKIIWYRKLPEVSPPERLSDALRPQGRIQSPTTVIAMSKRPTSARQLILQPAPKIELEQDIKAPNMIAVIAPPPPPLAPKPRKLFAAPPSPAPPRAEDPQLDQGPEIKPTTGDLKEPGHSLPLPSVSRPVKLFVPPPPKLAPGEAIILGGPDESVSAASGLGGQISGPAALVTPLKLPPKPFSLPSGGRPSGSGSGSGSGPPTLEAAPNLQSGANLSAAIVGLNPTGALATPLPPGSRPAQFSTAPNIGPPATGDVSGGKGIALPDLMIHHGNQPQQTPENSAGPTPNVATLTPNGATSRTVLYQDLVSGSIRQTLSAPLRPSSRTIPLALEARFQGRLAYAIVIPAPRLPDYTGDWIIWFAELDAKPGEVHVVRAPLPLQKNEPLISACPASGDRPEIRIRLAAIIKKDGRFDSIAPLKGPGATSLGAVEDLKRWEFQPATRDGLPVAVEAVFEIPFCLASLASSH
jgi:hypothetical protein